MKTRFAYAFGLLSAGLGTVVLAGCPDPEVPVDAAMLSDTPPIVLEDAGRDARVVGRDTGMTMPGACGTRGNIGGQCASGECNDPYVCQEEVVMTRPSVRRSDGMPGRAYPIQYWPGGQCQVACDPNANGQCNDCSSCLQTDTDTSGNPVGQCFQTCEQDVDGRGGCNEGYGCDRANLACLVACAVVDGVDTCEFSFEDRDTDPTTRETIVDEGADYASSCNVATGLCETRGTAGATAGDDCEEDLDCEDDGLCLSGDDAETPVTLLDGYCVRLGCNDTDLACQDGDNCTQSLFGLPGGVCMDGCVVGSETTAGQRVGAAGGNPNCGTGEACFWDGVHGAADEFNGGCYPANYNTVTEYNVGAPCDTDDECYSPFGVGRCLFGEGNSLGDRVGSGVCAIGGCANLTGGGVGLRNGAMESIAVAADVTMCAGATAGNNDICVGFSETQSFCVSGCTTAADCPAGYACPNLGSALSPLNLCWPACQVDADCNTGATCRNDARGPCNPDTDTCYCTDSMPRPDAGAVRDAGSPRDAGTDAPSTVDAAEAPDAPATDDAFAG
ncbi:MAG: hypothetical protein J0L92_20920 [Deltaproteobacteria bacterium]|nr:hypothetical protein [Deltaproteobacteria bacterium]